VIGNVVREREQIRWFDRHPLFGKRVLITRPNGQADEFAARLWEIGAEPLLAPTIAIEPPDDRTAALAAVREVRKYGWIVFTSVNGVEAFFARLAELGRDTRALADVRVAAIGPKTAESLGQRGVRADLVPARFMSEEVAAGLRERTAPGDRILLYRAQEARDVLPATLGAHGRIVDVVAAYKTIFRRDPSIAAQAQAADIWTFTSASTVHAFAQNVPELLALSTAKCIACIGPITAEAARACGLRTDVVALEYTIDGLIEALEAFPAALRA